MPWVSSTVVTREPKGTIRLCLDSRDLNGATRRTPYYVRTIDDVILQYPKGTDGKCCHLDLPAVEMFQENVATVSGKLNGLSGIADDPFVYGKSEKGIISTYSTSLTQQRTIMYGSTQMRSSSK